MRITDPMIQAAVKRAMELGVLPRRGVADDIATNKEIMEEILHAAINTGSQDKAQPPSEDGASD